MKIATINNLEVLLSNAKTQCFHISVKNGPTENLLKENISSAKILHLNDRLNFSTYLNEQKILKLKKIINLLKKKKIDTFFITDNSSMAVENWAKKNKIKLITIPFKEQKRLENKVIFQKILEKENLTSPKSWIIQSPDELKKINEIPAVIQIAESHGGEGTFFINKKSELLNIAENKKNKYPLLVREYMKGAAYGATILISKNRLIFSTPRKQLYELDDEKKISYMGIQWVKNSDLTKETIKNINDSLKKLGEALQKQNFTGIANIDFIIRKNKFYFIECNPRLSGSTPQLSMKKELLHGKSFVEEYVCALSGEELTKNIPYIPKTNYEGTTIDLDFLKKIKNKKIEMPNESGVFTYKNGKITFSSYKIKEALKKNNIFIYHTIAKASHIKKETALGIIITHEKFNKKFINDIKKTILK